MSFDKLLKNLRDDDGGTKIDIDEIGRHRDGQKQTLSDIVDVEYGSNANGTYEKFSDGRMKCYHTAAMGSRNALGSGSSTNVYRTDAYKWVYPAEFIEPPTISSHAMVTSSNASDRAASIVSSHIESDYTLIQMFFMSSTSGKSDTYASLEAEGRWKN